MKINGKEIVESKDWLCREILNSIPHEVITKAKDEGREEYEIKLVIDGVECDPKLLMAMLNRYEEIVDREAKTLAAAEIEKIQDNLNEKVNKFNEILDEAKSKIMGQYQIEED